MTTQTPPAPPAARPSKQRGRETALDMIRSLAVVMLLVIPMWFLGQPPASDVQTLREVDQTPDVRAWSQVQPGAPVPGALPAEWTPTVAQLVREPQGLRLGWNTAERQYAEFAATTGPAAQWLEDITGATSPDGAQDVDGAPWQRYRDEDGSLSLSRTYGDVTVVVGTRRSTASAAELLVLARSVRPGP